MGKYSLVFTSSYITTDSSEKKEVDLGLKVVLTNTDQEPTEQIRTEITDFLIGDNTICSNLQQYGNSATVDVAKNESTSMRECTIMVTSEIFYRDEMNMEISDGKSTATVTIQQDPNIANVEVPPPPAMPPEDTSEAEKEMVDNRTDAEIIREEVDKILSKVWADLLALGQEFVQNWTDKLYDILGKLDSVINQELAIRRSKVYSLCESAIKIAKQKQKILTELRKERASQDQLMIQNWNDKITECQENIQEMIEDLTENHSLSESGETYLEKIEDWSQEEIAQFMQEDNLTGWCSSNFDEDEVSLRKKLRNMMSVSNIGRMIKEKFNQLKSDGMVLLNGVKDMVSSAVTSVTEPMGAIIVTPVGPGACASNIMQVRGVLKRVQSQAVALVKVVTGMIDAAIFLGLPASLIQTLIGISTSLTIVGSIKIP